MAPLGRSVAEFNQFTASKKSTGNVYRVGFSIRADSEIVVKLISNYGEMMTVTLHETQEELFPEEPEFDEEEEPEVMDEIEA